MGFDESDREYLKRLYPKVDWGLASPRCAVIVDPLPGIVHSWMRGDTGPFKRIRFERRDVATKVTDAVNYIRPFRLENDLALGSVVAFPRYSTVVMGPLVAVWTFDSPREDALFAWKQLHPRTGVTKEQMRVAGVSFSEAGIFKALLGDFEDLDEQEKLA